MPGRNCFPEFKNIATGETSKAITSFHFFDNLMHRCVGHTAWAPEGAKNEVKEAQRAANYIAIDSFLYLTNLAL